MRVRFFVLVASLVLIGMSPTRFSAPRLECVYHMTNDQVLEYWSTPAGAFHLPKQVDGKFQVVSPTDLLEEPPMWRDCTDYINGDEDDLPFSLEKMLEFHDGYVHREAPVTLQKSS